MVTSVTQLICSERLAHFQLLKILHGIDHIETTRKCNACGRITRQLPLATTTRGHHLKYQIQHNSGLRHHTFPTRTFNKLTGHTVLSRIIWLKNGENILNYTVTVFLIDIMTPEFAED